MASLGSKAQTPTARWPTCGERAVTSPPRATRCGWVRCSVSPLGAQIRTCPMRSWIPPPELGFPCTAGRLDLATDQRMADYVGPGAFANPDFLEVGYTPRQPKQSPAVQSLLERRSMFTMCAHRISWLHPCHARPSHLLVHTYATQQRVLAQTVLHQLVHSRVLHSLPVPWICSPADLWGPPHPYPVPTPSHPCPVRTPSIPTLSGPLHHHWPTA